MTVCPYVPAPLFDLNFSPALNKAVSPLASWPTVPNPIAGAREANPRSVATITRE